MQGDAVSMLQMTSSLIADIRLIGWDKEPLARINESEFVDVQLYVVARYSSRPRSLCGQMPRTKVIDSLYFNNGQ